MSKTTLSILVASAFAAACGGKQEGSKDTAPLLEVSWDRTVSLTDLLPAADESGSGPMTAVGIAPRDQSAEGTREGASLDPAFEVRTHCGERHCLDAIFLTEKTADGAVVSLVDPRPTDDETTILESGSGSWVERGIKITQVTETHLSFLEGQASMSDGAAHSTGDVLCRTHARRENDVTRTRKRGPSSVAALAGKERADLLLGAANAFIERERELGEPRAAHLRELDSMNVLLGAKPGEYIFCLAYAVEASAGTVELVRVQLVR